MKNWFNSFNKKAVTVGKITVNGKTYTGNNVSVINNQVYIDGKLASEEKYTGVVEVKITGDVSVVNADAPVTIHGNVGGDVSSSGYVSCHNVSGSVDASGYVACKDVKESVSAGGYVNCGNVGGNVKAGGYVTRR